MRLYWNTATLICVGFPGGSDGKESAHMWETWLPSLRQEGPLEEEMATYSSILAWEIPWTEESGRHLFLYEHPWRETGLKVPSFPSGSGD